MTESIYVFAGSHHIYKTWATTHDPTGNYPFSYVKDADSVRGLPMPFVIIVLGNFWSRTDAEDIIKAIDPRQVIFHPWQLIVSMEDNMEYRARERKLVQTSKTDIIGMKQPFKTSPVVNEPCIEEPYIPPPSEQPWRKEKIHFKVIGKQ